MLNKSKFKIHIPLRLYDILLQLDSKCISDIEADTNDDANFLVFHEIFKLFLVKYKICYHISDNNSMYSDHHYQNEQSKAKYQENKRNRHVNFNDDNNSYFYYYYGDSGAKRIMLKKYVMDEMVTLSHLFNCIFDATFCLSYKNEELYVSYCKDYKRLFDKIVNICNEYNKNKHRNKITKYNPIFHSSNHKNYMHNDDYNYGDKSKRLNQRQYELTADLSECVKTVVLVVQQHLEAKNRELNSENEENEENEDEKLNQLNRKLECEFTHLLKQFKKYCTFMSQCFIDADIKTECLRIGLQFENMADDENNNNENNNSEYKFEADIWKKFMVSLIVDLKVKFKLSILSTIYHFGNGENDNNISTSSNDSDNKSDNGNIVDRIEDEMKNRSDEFGMNECKWLCQLLVVALTGTDHGGLSNVNNKQIKLESIEEISGYKNKNKKSKKKKQANSNDKNNNNTNKPSYLSQIVSLSCHIEDRIMAEPWKIELIAKTFWKYNLYIENSKCIFTINQILKHWKKHKLTTFDKTKITFKELKINDIYELGYLSCYSIIWHDLLRNEIFNAVCDSQLVNNKKYELTHDIVKVILNYVDSIMVIDKGSNIFYDTYGKDFGCLPKFVWLDTKRVDFVMQQCCKNDNVFKLWKQYFDKKMNNFDNLSNYQSLVWQFRMESTINRK